MLLGGIAQENPATCADVLRYVSSNPATRADVLNLQKDLDTWLQQRQAREVGGKRRKAKKKSC